MSRRKKDFFGDSLKKNMNTYYYYVNLLTEIAINRFKWLNLPDTCDSRYLELSLFRNGSAVFFNDEDIGYLTLEVIANGPFNVYGYPIYRRAYSSYNQYQKNLDNTDSVIIYNNAMRTNNLLMVENFSQRLYNIDRTIDINVNGQKTPTLLQGNEKQRLSLLNLYKEYDGNAPVIFGNKDLDLSGITSISTNAPFVSDKLYDIKNRLWNEALDYLGISNITINKRERLTSNESFFNQGSTEATRNIYLNARKHACEKINNVFGLEVDVEFNENILEYMMSVSTQNNSEVDMEDE